jgi:hypothetical protein
MTPAQLGFVRGLAYAIGATVCAYVVANLGGAGILPPAISAIVVAVAGSIEHYVNS